MVLQRVPADWMGWFSPPTEAPSSHSLTTNRSLMSLSSPLGGVVGSILRTIPGAIPRTIPGALRLPVSCAQHLATTSRFSFCSSSSVLPQLPRGFTSLAASSIPADQNPAEAPELGRHANTYASAVLCRLPLVVPEDPPWLKEWNEYLETRAMENTKTLPDRFGNPRLNEDELALADTWKPEPMVSEEDEDERAVSLRRRVDRFLYFVCRERGGPWMFPTAAHREGETIRGTAQRALQAAIGCQCVAGSNDDTGAPNAPNAHKFPSSGGIYGDVDVYFVGHAPALHVHLFDNQSPALVPSVLKDDKATVEEAPVVPPRKGREARSTVFYHRAILLTPGHDDVAFENAMKRADAQRGGVSAKDALEWAWITRDEFSAFIGETSGSGAPKFLERLRQMAQ